MSPIPPLSSLNYPRSFPAGPFLSLTLSMDSGAQRVSAELLPYVRVYEDGRVERLKGSEFVPASLNDTQTGVSSKDVLISSESAVSARLFLPKLTCNRQKLPVLVYFHGGAFCIESAFSFLFHRYLNILVNEANVVAVSVEYRRAPEHLLPAAYEDCWAALEWVSSHSVGRGANYEPWLTDYADFDRIFLGGDSAGGNIVHNVAMRAGSQSLPHNIRVRGAFLVHPYFWGSEPIGSESMEDHTPNSLANRVWLFVCPSSAAGVDDPMINPMSPGAPRLSKLGCSRLLVCVAGKDILCYRGRLYHSAVGNSGWEGEVELFEVEGEGHVYHIFDPYTENAGLMIKRLASFLNS
uniref:Alpha/beta hydrolase fold-3 domain-containing protein n=1 Tax=Nelumbo nucifera TaxID=4432 RepID=A0A822YQJ1_NELNU|nr:TPA_asm: hypothetical protein HUJ06_012480 [Nelumbo nucifera]